jgi:bacterioferritin (cytochrome b1)
MSQEGILLNLQKGLESEYRALELCKTLSETLESQEDKAVVEKIMHDEENHVRITENLIKIVKDSYKG